MLKGTPRPREEGRVVWTFCVRRNIRSCTCRRVWACADKRAITTGQQGNARARVKSWSIRVQNITTRNRTGISVITYNTSAKKTIDCAIRRPLIFGTCHYKLAVPAFVPPATRHGPGDGLASEPYEFANVRPLVLLETANSFKLIYERGKLWLLKRGA